jgi:hypothetical protein
MACVLAPLRTRGQPVSPLSLVHTSGTDIPVRNVLNVSVSAVVVPNVQRFPDICCARLRC